MPGSYGPLDGFLSGAAVVIGLGAVGALLSHFPFTPSTANGPEDRWYVGPHPDQEAAGGRDHGQNPDGVADLVASILDDQRIIAESRLLERMSEAPDNGGGKPDLNFDHSAASSWSLRNRQAMPLNPDSYSTQITKSGKTQAKPTRSA